MIRWSSIPLFFFLSFAQAATGEVQFSDGWIKQLPPVVPMRAGYLTIKNPGDQARTITHLQSDAFANVEIHETRMADGMMKMVELPQLVIPAKGEVELKSGGKHLMLIDPAQPLQIGDRVSIRVDFSNGQQQDLTLEVKK